MSNLKEGSQEPTTFDLEKLPSELIYEIMYKLRIKEAINLCTAGRYMSNFFDELYVARYIKITRAYDRAYNCFKSSIVYDTDEKMSLFFINNFFEGFIPFIDEQPISVLVMRGQKNAAELVLNLCKNIGKVLNVDYLIHLACKKGYNKIIKLLIKGFNGDPSCWGNDPIHAACENGKYETVKLLLRDSRVNPGSSDRDFNHRSALWWAIVHGGDPRIVELLLNDERVDSRHCTLWAINCAFFRTSHVSVINFLLEKHLITFDMIDSKEIIDQ